MSAEQGEQGEQGEGLAEKRGRVGGDVRPSDNLLMKGELRNMIIR